MTNFDPQALYGLDQTLDDDSTIVQVDDDEVRRIAAAETRRRCAGIKLASRVVGMATAMSGDVIDADLLRSLDSIMDRVASIREAGLGLLGVRSDSSDFAPAFNALTNIALDVVTEEWKWAQLAPGKSRSLSKPVLLRLFEQVVNHQAIGVMVGYPEAPDLERARKLCAMEALPKVYGLVNLFDYYQADHEALVNRLLLAVVAEAEKHANMLTPSDAIEFTRQSVLQRLYGVSVGLMCEVYKHHAARDVMRLRSMAPVDRSIMIAQYERLGGMSYDHVIEAHSRTLERVSEMSELIVESQKRR
ncbi:hypothetical protein [Bordetella flabilis]|uniref:Uncharacterized protein n=1 Tax=Bordetella flabilis TaxID=463014 RepID=A0A193GNC4_9BORD|nr:hypothetical protein [Bordetella flabilis]ANN80869.1 hypothetical protein BAU07_26470 [Bordetella flabilis]